MNSVFILNSIAVGLILLTIVKCWSDFKFFREQRKTSEKYDFYRLRSKLHRLMLASEAPLLFNDLDQSINKVISDLENYSLDFDFFNKALKTACDTLIQVYAKEGKEGLEKYLEKIYSDNSPNRVIERELWVLLMKTARENNVLLKFAMSPLGHSLLMKYHLLRALERIQIDHSSDQYTSTIGAYSVLGHSFKSEQYA